MHTGSAVRPSQQGIEMTMLNVVEAKKGAEVFGLKSGQTLFTSHESECFYFVEIGNSELKISKRTNRLAQWGSASTSPIFEVVEFEAADGDWRELDDAAIKAAKK
jgi:hypothetical protein